MKICGWRRRIVVGALIAALAGVVLFIYWKPISTVVNARWYLVWGDAAGRFGTEYGHIGTWRRWIRNVTNLPIVFGVGVSIPALIFAVHGVRQVLKTRENASLWLVHGSALAYLLYMVVLGPVTYYRHYLPLLPPFVLLSAYGFWSTRWAHKKLLLVLFLLYPLVLTLDSELDYWNDTRLEVRAWMATHPEADSLFSFYVVPPPGISMDGLFNESEYLQLGREYLHGYDHLILSESWYDTAFANELNGPIAWKPEWLIKTTPANAKLHRRILSGQDPNFLLDTEFLLRDFTPEFFLHRALYGSFQLFVGDMKIFRMAPFGES
jgi:hypothetical protein